MGTPINIFLYAPGVHDGITRRIPQDIFTCGKGCQELLQGVQELADRRGGNGDKSNGRLYLHYIQPADGYSPAAHEQVLRELGLSGKKSVASLDDFVRAADLRAFAHISKLISKSHGRLSNQEAGEILYILGTLLHAHQDRKHLEGNITDHHGDGITSSAHLSWDGHQLFSDIWPSANSKSRALNRSVEFMKRFKKQFQNENPTYSKEAFQRLAQFKMLKGKRVQNYKPPQPVMDKIFPHYPTGDLQSQGHWVIRTGYFWGKNRSGFTGELGHQWYLPRWGMVRMQTGLGLTFNHDRAGRSEIGAKVSYSLSEQVDFIGLGVQALLGMDDRQDKFIGVQGALRLFEGNFLFQINRRWYEQGSAETQFSIMMDPLALARSFEWLPRKF